MKRPLFEVCANGLASALAAQHAGADRIELCDALELGGLTPSYGSLQLVREQISLPVRVLIRPRPGNFQYSADEKLLILKDIELVREMGFEGVVVGALDTQNMPDMAFLEKVNVQAKDLKITFHRAIDASKNPVEALKMLVGLGFNCVLTSGAEPTAFQGISAIRALMDAAEGQICVMAGGGVRPENIRQILAETAVPAIHFSASVQRGIAKKDTRETDRTGSPLWWTESDEELIMKMMDEAQKK